MASRTLGQFSVVTALAAGVVVVAGCGSEKESGGVADAPAKRARQVAAAWDGSTAGATWRAGYHPVGETVQLPRGGLRSQVDRRAYQSQNFTLASKLPSKAPKDGVVDWTSGKSLRRPLMGADQTYKALDRADVNEPPLTVTGAKLGEMSVATSRGPATVPAWLFTLKGYTSPLKRAAVDPSQLPEPPIKPAHGLSDSQLAPLDRLVRISPDKRSVTVIAFNGACDDGAAVDVLETDGSIVLSAFVKNPEDGLCTTQAKEQKISVKLDRPVADRVLLDAHTGRPVP
ncbi:hypothetical protein [Streptomyces sp. NBC_01304]|uniref:hypothetical protein n=1 Tax=Streptomyces sp. NBC_01304 TaxID=2903818 RepID=UPI002E1117F8